MDPKNENNEIDLEFIFDESEVTLLMDSLEVYHTVQNNNFTPNMEEIYNNLKEYFSEKLKELDS
jgi:hypothetical protein